MPYSGMGDADYPGLTDAQVARYKQLTASVANDIRAIATLNGQGNTLGAAAVTSSMKLKTAELARLRAIMNANDLTATDRAVISTGQYIQDAYNAGGSLVHDVAAGAGRTVGDTAGGLLGPVGKALSPLLLVLGVVILMAGKSGIVGQYRGRK